MESRFFGNRNSDIVFVQPIFSDDNDSVSRELELVRHETGKDILIAAVAVDDWNRDLSPWEAEAVFGEEGFGSGAGKTLEYILAETVPDARATKSTKLYLGGYSLAGLFALWAACNTDIFDGVAAVSPSVWFPGFTDFVKANRIMTPRVYLSIGDKEEKVRNSVVSQVGDNLREIHRFLTSLGISSTLEYNPGNHFRDPEIRVSKGIVNLMKTECC